MRGEPAPSGEVQADDTKKNGEESADTKKDLTEPLPAGTVAAQS